MSNQPVSAKKWVVCAKLRDLPDPSRPSELWLRNNDSNNNNIINNNRKNIKRITSNNENNYNVSFIQNTQTRH